MLFSDQPAVKTAAAGQYSLDAAARKPMLVQAAQPFTANIIIHVRPAVEWPACIAIAGQARQVLMIGCKGSRGISSLVAQVIDKPV